MNIAYIVNARIPTEKAHGFQVAKVCEALSDPGHKVSLIVPNRSNQISEDYFSYYQVRRNIEVKKLSVFDWGFRIQSFSFLLSLMCFSPSKDTIIITRDPEIAFLFIHRGYVVFYYAHRWPQSKNTLFKFLLKGVSGIICNSKGTEDEFRRNKFLNTLIVPNAVDLSDYAHIEDRSILRTKLHLPHDKHISMYVGHLYTWKGIDVVIESARLLHTRSKYVFVIVGGTEADISKYKDIVSREGINNVLIVGHVNHSMIPKYLTASDVLLLPNIPSSKESEYYTSPIKMFEYMASGIPIIASDMPSIREVLNDTKATLIPAGNARVLADTIIKSTTDYSKFTAKAEVARNEVKAYTWSNLASKIVNFVNKAK